VPKDPRCSCKFCTYTVQDGKNVMHHSYFANENPKKTSNFCFQCKEALCNTPPTTVGENSHDSCQHHFHNYRQLPFQEKEA
jgi:succinate dehydrogenase/fumarate reductase-like Fe-S protein